MKKTLFFLAALLLEPSAALFAAPTAASAPFESADRWCALGDSITEGDYYHRYVELFYQTRFPQRKLDVVDCGIRGDTALRAAQRVQWDCLLAKPTVVSVMLGMNDVGWNLIRLPAAELEGRRGRAGGFGQACASHRRGVPNNRRGLQRADGGNQRGTAEAQPAVEHCGAGPRASHPARTPGDGVWVSQGPETARDRLAHQRGRGHGQGGALENCAVEKFAVGADEIRFSCHEKSLPFPVEAKAAPGGVSPGATV